jgi:hypothetical protein
MKARFESVKVTEQFLNDNPAAYFVYGDNMQHLGTGGAAKLRHHPKAIGFVTKKAPNNNPSSFFTVEEYTSRFFQMLTQLEGHIKEAPQHTFYVSKLGAGLANRHLIWEKLIGHNLVETLGDYENVVFCWDLEE